VETILVVGIDTVVGGNLAAHFADTLHVTGLSPTRPIAVGGCENATCSGDDAHRWVREVRPDVVLYCGPEAHSAWEPRGNNLSERSPDVAVAWASAAKEHGCPFTLLSSDAVFTGPWMFHDESSTSFCDSPEAGIVRSTENRVRECCPAALIVRTNAFGWSPAGDEDGWVESILNSIEQQRVVECDWIRHATPLLATDLADILERAWHEHIEGLFHIAGSERVNPLQFAQRLADQFDLPWLAVRREKALTERATGFGAGETSLQTKHVRKALCVAMPMLSEGLARLRAQHLNGFRDRFEADTSPIRQRVA
jgi:dTDP-4-dehydrorhamnose reductase